MFESLIKREKLEFRPSILEFFLDRHRSLPHRTRALSRCCMSSAVFGVRSIQSWTLVAKWSARALHQDHQRDGQERHEHHQLEIVDERDGLGLRGHYLGEGGASAQGGEIELVRIVAHYLPVRRDMLDECGLRRGGITHQEITNHRTTDLRSAIAHQV